MGQKLLPVISKKIVFLFAFLLGVFAQEGYGQTMLSKGDITIVSINAGSGGHFDFVPLVKLEPGTKIQFTDNAFVETEGMLEDNEGTLVYTAPASISAGSVISYEGTNSNGFETSGNFAIDTDGENILAYQMLNDEPNYLFGIGWGKGDSIWKYDPASISDSRSDIPPGLKETDNTILRLDSFSNQQYNVDYGLKGTSTSILDLVADPSHWKGSDVVSYSPFENVFVLTSAPALAFSSNYQKGKEGETVDITVELVEANGSDITVDVMLIDDMSTAVNEEDFQYQVNESITFSEKDINGTTKTISLMLKKDGNLEESETAVFELRNTSAGTIIDPTRHTVTIEDDDSINPGIVVNEIYAAPDDDRGDADGDGIVDSESDEFIEFVNNSSSAIDISGWTLSDKTDLRHTFPSGTILNAEGALVLFGSSKEMPQGNFGGAVIQRSNESSTLGLNDDGDTIYLRNEQGTEVVAVSYGSTDEQSLVMKQGIPGDFTAHAETSSLDRLFSPGTTVDGKAFASSFGVGIRGTQGWRTISTPTQNTSFQDLLSGLKMQGIPGSDDPNGVFTLAGWDESRSEFSDLPSDMSETMVPGKGYIMYVFEGDTKPDADGQDNLFKVISTDETENNSPVRVRVSASDSNGENGIDAKEGWNLLGNPFGVELSVSALISELETVSDSVNANVYVWKHHKGNGNGEFVALEEGDHIAPFQAFFVRFSEPFEERNVQLDKKVLQAKENDELYDSDTFGFDFFLHGDQYYDTYTVEFDEEARVDMDRKDAFKLFSLNPSSINLYSTIENSRLRTNALPNELESVVEIPIAFDANGQTELLFEWSSIEEIPTSWDVKLIDSKINREIDLRTAREYRFTTSPELDAEKSEQENELLNKGNANSSEPRFLLAIDPGVNANKQNDVPAESVQLKPNYPNPFNTTTTIPYELTQDSEVKLTVWNMIGQKVATLVEGSVEQGTYQETWNAGNMPSGIYIARFEVNGVVFTRKMTLIK